MQLSILSTIIPIGDKDFQGDFYTQKLNLVSKLQRQREANSRMPNQGYLLISVHVVHWQQWLFGASAVFVLSCIGSVGAIILLLGCGFFFAFSLVLQWHISSLGHSEEILCCFQTCLQAPCCAPFILCLLIHFPSLQRIRCKEIIFFLIVCSTARLKVTLIHKFQVSSY